MQKQHVRMKQDLNRNPESSSMSRRHCLQTAVVAFLDLEQEEWQCHGTSSVPSHLFHPISSSARCGSPSRSLLPNPETEVTKGPGSVVCPSPSTLPCPLDASLMEQGKGKNQVLPADQNKTLSPSPGWVCQHLLQAWGAPSGCPPPMAMGRRGALCRQVLIGTMTANDWILQRWDSGSTHMLPWQQRWRCQSQPLISIKKVLSTLAPTALGRARPLLARRS